MACGLLQEYYKYHAGLFNAGAEDMASELGDALHGFTNGLKEGKEGESFGNGGDIYKQTENKALSTDKQAFLSGDKRE